MLTGYNAPELKTERKIEKTEKKDYRCAGDHNRHVGDLNQHVGDHAQRVGDPYTLLGTTRKCGKIIQFKSLENCGQ